MKNRLILKIVNLLKKPVVHSSETKKILVVSSTALGDTLWATPALESLRKSFPDAYIALLTTPIGEQALRHNPWVDRTYVFQEPLLPRIYKLWKLLREEAFQDVVIFHASQRLMVPLCALLGAERVVGTSGINKGLDELLTDPVPPLFQHEIERRIGLIERIGASAHSDTLSFFLQPEERAAACFTRTHAPLIALHPGSKDGFKRWPTEHFVAVGKALTEMGAEMLITGTPAEIPLMQEIGSHIPEARLIDPKLSLRSFAAVVEQLDLLISNDTGPVHVASALKTPVIALYSPTNPVLCGPHKAEHASVVAHPPSCTPCLKRACRRPFCMLQIGPEEVIQSAKELLMMESAK